MSVSESQRHQLFQWFEEAMGPERAAVMMDLLPPVGWGDLATKRDLDGLRIELQGDMTGWSAARREDRRVGRHARREDRRLVGTLDGKIGVLDGKIGLLEGKMEHGFGRLQKSIYLAMLASNATIAGLVLAVLKAA